MLYLHKRHFQMEQEKKSHKENLLGVTQFDCQTVDFIQLAIYAAKRQLTVMVELLISTA
ncbi:hypothetical protein LDFHOB_01760 [Candidatus Electronema aureum]